MRPTFSGELVVELAHKPNGSQLMKNGRVVWQVVSPLSFGEITVPAGTLTDLASIPRPLWVILPPDGEYAQAAVVHDYLYTSHGRDGRYSRGQSDKVLLQAMEALGVPAWQRLAVYVGVRAGGWIAWGTFPRGTVA